MGIRLATLAFPPAGLLILLRSRPSARELVPGLLFIALYSVVYGTLIVAALLKAQLLHLEWRGTGIPSVTPHPTRPDFDKLESHRDAQRLPVSTNRTGGTYWSGFRGANRSGRYDELPVNFRWSETPPKLLWKQPIGGGYASFAIARGVAYTIEQRRDEEAVTAYDIATGTELWAMAWPARFEERMGGDGPRSTPTWHDGRVYAVGGTGELRCLDGESGATIWRRDVLNDTVATPLHYGACASPLMLGDAVVVLGGNPAGKRGRGMIAYDRGTGEILWQALNEKVGYASPVLAAINGVDQILTFTGHRFLGLDPGSREVLWQFPWKINYDNAIAQPLVVTTNQVFISAGYGKGCALLEFQNDKDAWSLETKWRNIFMKNKFSSSVLHEGHIYGLDNDIMVCLDVATGRKQWKDGRYGYGQIILVHDHVLVLCGDGDMALVKCNPEEHEEVARIPALDGKTWNHPAMADGLLLIRNSATMACYDLRLAAP